MLIKVVQAGTIFEDRATRLQAEVYVCPTRSLDASIERRSKQLISMTKGLQAMIEERDRILKEGP